LIFICSSNISEPKQSDTWNNSIDKLQAQKNLKFDMNSNVDTLTTWHFYLDDKLIYKSHEGRLNDQIVKIDTTEQYKFFKFQIFYDFHKDVDERKIEMIAGNQLIALYTQTNDTFLPFEIPKYEFELMDTKYLEQVITLKFYDPVNPNGLVVGRIKFTKK
jgi:hypothetical protein